MIARAEELSEEGPAILLEDVIECLCDIKLFRPASKADPAIVDQLNSPFWSALVQYSTIEFINGNEALIESLDEMRSYVLRVLSSWQAIPKICFPKSVEPALRTAMQIVINLFFEMLLMILRASKSDRTVIATRAACQNMPLVRENGPPSQEDQETGYDVCGHDFLNEIEMVSGLKCPEEDPHD